MEQGLRVCIVGAGSSYTPELIEGLVTQGPAELPVAEIGLTDINADRLAVMSGLAERAIRHAGARSQSQATCTWRPCWRARTSSSHRFASAA